MSPLPVRMVDRWHDRVEPGPGQGLLYWHVLLGTCPEVVDVARLGQRRLAAFSAGLHFTPLKWLHLTTLIVGSPDAVNTEQINAMVSQARRRLSEVSPITVTLSRVLYHPQAIMLAAEPAAALRPIATAVQDATRIATGSEGTLDTQPWIPHMTLAYSTKEQPAGPIISALGRRLPESETTIESITLVVQQEAERRWDWRPIADIRLGGPSVRGDMSHRCG